MSLSTGARLGPYEIQSPLGAGGMGEVYKARDTRLDRTVALKVLPSHVATDPDLRQRFDREARAVAALNHPHICTLHDIGSQDGVDFLVMEYLEGETLADRLAKGALPLDQALRYGIEIADALDKAHRAGIVHRDLKPGNIMLTKSGAKLLDFGLAKTGAPVVAGTALSALPTTPPHLTAQGTILGTIQYMAPEQLEGQEADSRTDIFAFGAVLYEMLTGKKAFEGSSPASLIAAILDHEPASISTVRPLTPPSLEHGVHKCLAKDREARWQSARDLHDELKWIQQTASREVPQAIRAVERSPSRRLLWAAAAATTILASVAAGSMLNRGRVSSMPRHVTRFELALPNTEFTQTGRHIVTVSPDGSRLVYVANQQLYVRPLDRNDPEPIRGTAVDPSEPFFSPDGQWVAFWANNQFMKVAISGGAPITIGDAPNPFGTSWNGDSIFFANGVNGIFRMPASGGASEQVVALDPKAGEQAHGPQLLPGGDAILFTVRAGGAWDDAMVVVQSLSTGQRRIVIRGGTDARYLGSGHVVYGRQGSLFAVAFDAERAEVRGSPVSLLDGIASAISNQTGTVQFALSATGSLVYVRGVSGIQRSLVWLDRQGREQTISAPPRNYYYPRLSPDGTRIAVDVHDQERDIWIWDLTRDTSARLLGQGEEFNPIWTPDGQRLIYGLLDGPSSSVLSRLANGTGGEERLTTATMDYPQRSEAISPDGKSVAILNVATPGEGNNLNLLSLDEKRTVRPLVQTKFAESQAAFSPDGRWIAHISNESGRDEVYVRPFPAVNDGKWQVSTAGGKWPLWSPDGRELFYTSANSHLMAVAVETKDTFRAGTTVALFDMAPYINSSPGRPYDITRDGRRFLAVKNTNAGEMPRLQVIENWFDELTARVTTK